MRHKKTWWKRFWNFLWHEDSFASWIANIVLAFLLIKFVVYPVLSVLFGTSLPIVAVVSCSMEHDFTDCGADVQKTLCDSKAGTDNPDSDYWKHCGSFYEDHNITRKEFNTYPFEDGFNKGDVIFLKGEPPSQIDVGDILIYRGDDERSYPIIHRVIEKRQTENGETENGDFVFETKGDHNPAQINNSQINEHDIRKDDIIGTGMFRVSYVGYLKIWFVKLIASIGLV